MTGPAKRPTPARASGFNVESSLGGASDDGRLSWSPVGHATLTQAGWAAVLSLIASYIAGRPNIGPAVEVQVNGYAGSFAVANSDLAAQQAALIAVLSTTANITGPTV